MNHRGLLLKPNRTIAEENWPEFRGPNADGISKATGLPVQWSDTQNVRWKTPIPGRGWSTPVIWGKQIWLTTATPDGREMFVLCLDRETGKVLLNHRLFTNAQPETIHDLNSYASPSAVIEAGRVYVHFGNYGTACLDTKTLRVVWQRRDLTCLFTVGPGSSPVLYRNFLILTMDGVDVQYVAALDKKSGRTVWKQERTLTKGFSHRTAAENDRHKAFHTPVLAEVKGKPILLSPSAQAMYAYDPDTGRELWHVRHTGYSGSSRTLVGNGIAYINTGFDRSSLLAVRLDGRGDVTDTHLVWQASRSVPYKPSPVLVDDLIFLLSDSGIATCLEAKTGKEIWQERVGGSYSASPLYAEGRFYCFSERGKTTVLKAARNYEVLTENTMPDGFMASPAVAGKALFLRTTAHLYRVEQ